MSDGRSSPKGPWLVTEGARAYADLTDPVRNRLEDPGSEPGEGGGVLVAMASEIVAGEPAAVPGWVDTETFHLVFDDVALPALMRLPTRLGLHKPDRRLHVTRDRGALARLLVARIRDVPSEGIVDAYAVGRELVLVLGDLTIRSFPADAVPGLARLDGEDLGSVEIDPDGSFLRWSRFDLDLGVPSLLQAVDPAYRAEMEIERLEREDTGGVLKQMREERGLRQRDVPGLSERQVRRLEKGTSRLTADAARSFAEALDVGLDRFLEELGTRLEGDAGSPSGNPAPIPAAR